MNVAHTYFYKICEWIMRLALVNLLWLSFTILGLVVLGIVPSTIAMYTIVRKWVMGETDIRILRTFWGTYKREWLKSNRLGMILGAISAFIAVEYWIIYNVQEPLIQLSKYPLLLIFICFILLLLYVFPTYVHYDVNVRQVLKNSFLIMIINPAYNLVILLGLLLVYLSLTIVPALLLFFGGSVSAFVIMWGCYQSFLRVEQKKERNRTLSE
ncbi:YesL family protein [Bacillus alkalicellulosilyticus]|uniref:YesL family protein n=1 Tax=Alkalihalobacterium alkalicellulosilyticum TaxID=1912214 RepID=UPI000997BECB|nr:YesL family protein [Bacillus alkalicellulosilyticus]